MSTRSAVAILNCHSGCEDTRKIARRLESLAAEIGVQCDIVVTRTLRQIVTATQRAVRSNCQTVIAGGGDGTINAVASQLIGTEKQLGVLPLGTFNHFAREVGVPANFEDAFRTCFDGSTRPVTIGEVNGRIFLNNASIGLYPLILSIREQTYRKWGRHKIAAYWSVLRTLFRPYPNLKLIITANGERRTVRTPLLFVARNSYQLEQFNVPGTRCVAADAFSVYIVRPMSKSQLLRFAYRAFRHQLEPTSDFEMFCTSELRVESRRIHRSVAFDGERAKMLAPLEFRVREHALRIAVPSVEKRESVA